MRISMLALLPLLSGCGMAVAVATAGSPAVADQPETRAERVALALVGADAAAQRHDAAALARAVGTIDDSGAAALEGSPQDPLPGWRAQVQPQSPPLRGRALGPAYRSGRLSATGRESLAQLFLSGKDATVALSAPEGGRIAVVVRDKEAREVCRGEASGPRACRWVPLYTQRYTIELANLSKREASYFLVID